MLLKTVTLLPFAQFGVSNIFSREAELSGVSSVEGLFVQELVQHVAVRVDNADSSASQLTGEYEYVIMASMFVVV